MNNLKIMAEVAKLTNKTELPDGSKFTHLVNKTIDISDNLLKYKFNYPH